MAGGFNGHWVRTRGDVHAKTFISEFHQYEPQRRPRWAHYVALAVLAAVLLYAVIAALL